MKPSEPNIFITGLLAAFLLGLIVMTLGGCKCEPQVGVGDKVARAGARIDSASSRVAAHVQAAREVAVALTPAAPLALVGNLDAALAGLPKPTVDDVAYVAALKTVENYRKASVVAESETRLAREAVAKLQGDLDAMRAGREEDRKDGDARLWRLAAVALVAAGAVTGYLFKDVGRSAILAGAGFLCGLMPAFLDSGAIKVGLYAVGVLTVAAVGWLGVKLYRSEPVVKSGIEPA